MRYRSNTTSVYTLIAIFIVILWVIEAVNFITGHQLSAFGILPRSLKGLLGIPVSPFLHGGFFHLIMNTVPLAILGGFVALHGKDVFIRTTIAITLLGGAGLWMIGRKAYHVGASGLVFGYFGYLVSRGVVQKSIGSIVISVVTILVYGGMMWGVLPASGHVSWEGHLCGVLAGVLVALLEK